MASGRRRPHPRRSGYSSPTWRGGWCYRGMFFIDQQTLDYLKLTRDDEQVRLVETHAREAGLWADTWRTPSTSGCCTLTCRAWCAPWRPSNPHRRLPVPALPSAESRWTWTGSLPRG